MIILYALAMIVMGLVTFLHFFDLWRWYWTDYQQRQEEKILRKARNMELWIKHDESLWNDLERWNDPSLPLDKS